MTLARAVVCLALVVLAGCSKPGAAGDVVITQADLPKMKPGFWVTSVSENGGVATTSQHCETGEAVGMADVSKECSKFVFKRTPAGAIVIDADCASDGSSSTMHMTVSGDYNARVTGDAQVTMKLPGNPPMVVATHAESHYVGPCPAGNAG